MCLARVFTDAEMDEYLEGQPEVIEVWKVVEPHQAKGAFYSWEWPSWAYKYGFGLQKAEQTKIQSDSGSYYYSGFHCYPTFNSRLKQHKTKPRNSETIKCLARKDWITAVGIERKLQGEFITIVASQAIFPHYPETEARQEDLPKEEIKEEVLTTKHR